MYIDVNEELDASQIQEDDFKPIIAKSDCIIEQIIVERGTPLVAKGDAVKRGDILIAPYYYTDKDNEQYEPTPAVGTIYARVYAEEKTEFCERQIEIVKTGKSERTRILSLCNIKFGSIEPSKFDSYEEEINTFKIYGFPFVITECLRYEVQESIKFVPFDSVKEQIQRELLDKIMENFKNNVQILDKWCIIRNIMGRYILTGIVEYIDQVGVRGLENENS